MNRLNAISTLRTLGLAALVAALAQPALAALDAAPKTRLDEHLRCLLGSYEFANKQTITITGQQGLPKGLSYTLSDGRFGDLQPAEETGSLADNAVNNAVNNAGNFSSNYVGSALSLRFAPCSEGTLEVVPGKNGKERIEQGRRIPLTERAIRFVSDGNNLHGKLILPNGPAKALAVWIEGSNNNPSTDDAVWPYELARRGIAMFVYDKRGTGASEGAPSANFAARARDTAAAVQVARAALPSQVPTGVIGGSQGGWVAPLVAELTPLDFVITAFALAEGPIAQDQALVTQQLREAGFAAAAKSEGRELMAITERIVRSPSGDGLADLDAFKAKHASASWLKAILPRSYTGLFLQFSSDIIRTQGAAMAQGLDFSYDPRPVIERIKPRQLWLLAGKDRQAPNAEPIDAPSGKTQAILKQIQEKRSDLAVVVFPKADHGMIEPVSTPKGSVPAAKLSAKLFDVTAEWILQRKLPASGRFIMMPQN
jgi:uncharacterized protein